MKKDLIIATFREFFDDQYDSIAQLKTHVLRIVLISGVVAVLLIWLNESLFQVIRYIDFITYPIFASIMLIFSLLLSWRRTYYRIIGVIIFSFFMAYVFLYALHTLYIEDKQSRIYVVSSHLHVISLIYIIAFILFNRRNTLIVTFLSLLPVAAIMIYQAIVSLSGPSYAHDAAFLVDDFIFNAIQVVILMVASQIKDQFARIEAQTEFLKEMASIDYLTGVANRRHMENIIAHSFTYASKDLSVIMVDIDHFKLVNDTHGHDAGDQVLISVAQQLREHVRSTDTLGRWGGEEFIVVAPNTDIDHVARLAERLRLVLAQNTTAEIALTASFGVSVYQDGDSPDSLVKRADKAMYRAKTLGRNRVEIASH